MSYKYLLMSTLALVTVSTAEAQTSPTYKANANFSVLDSTGTYRPFTGTNVPLLDASGNVTSPITGQIDASTFMVDSGNTRRTVNLKLAEIVSIKDFGAKCDGSTDDSTAFQTALTQIATNAKFKNGARLLIPAGSCYISSATSATIADTRGISIEGAGKGQSTLMFGMSGPALTWMSTTVANGFVTKNLTYLHTGTSTNSIGLSITSSNAGMFPIDIDHVKVNWSSLNSGVSFYQGVYTLNASVNADDLYVHEPDTITPSTTNLTTGLWIQGTPGTATDGSKNLWSIDNKISNSTFQGGQFGIHVSGAVQGMFITNSEALGGNAGFYWDGTAANSFPELFMLSNFHSNSHQYGVYLNGVNQSFVSGGLFLHFNPDSTKYYSVYVNHSQQANVYHTQTNGTMSSTTSETAVYIANTNIFSVANNIAVTVQGPVVDAGTNSSYGSIVGNVGAVYPYYSGARILGCSNANSCVGNVFDTQSDFQNNGTNNISNFPFFSPFFVANVASGNGYQFTNSSGIYTAMASTSSSDVYLCPSSTCHLGSKGNSASSTLTPSVELGQDRASAGGALIDFHTTYPVNDFDARIFAVGGATPSTAGNTVASGTAGLQITAAALEVNAPIQASGLGIFNSGAMAYNLISTPLTNTQCNDSNPAGNSNGSSYLSQGLTICWNHRPGDGATSFVNTQGTGGGGFKFYNADKTGSILQASGSPLMFLDGSGNATFSGAVTSSSLAVKNNLTASGIYGGNIVVNNGGGLIFGKSDGSIGPYFSLINAPSGSPTSVEVYLSGLLSAQYLSILGPITGSNGIYINPTYLATSNPTGLTKCAGNNGNNATSAYGYGCIFGTSAFNSSGVIQQTYGFQTGITTPTYTSTTQPSINGTDQVGLYAEVRNNAFGTGGWGENILAQANKDANTTFIGEYDLNNLSGCDGLGIDYNYTTRNASGATFVGTRSDGSTCPIKYGLLLTGVAGNTADAGIAFQDVDNGSHSMWQDGIRIIGGYLVSEYEYVSATQSYIPFKIKGVHVGAGIDLSDSQIAGRGALSLSSDNNSTGRITWDCPMVAGCSNGSIMTKKTIQPNTTNNNLEFTGTTQFDNVDNLHYGRFATHMATVLDIVGFGASTSSTPITLTIDQAAESSTNSILSRIVLKTANMLGISAHLSCTDYHSAYWEGNVSAVFTYNTSSSKFTLVNSTATKTYASGDANINWTPAFSVSSTTNGPLLTVATTGADSNGIGCNAELHINENN